jgi:hypothetical protein
MDRRTIYKNFFFALREYMRGDFVCQGDLGHKIWQVVPIVWRRQTDFSRTPFLTIEEIPLAQTGPDP